MVTPRWVVIFGLVVIGAEVCRVDASRPYALIMNDVSLSPGDSRFAVTVRLSSDEERTGYSFTSGFVFGVEWDPCTVELSGFDWQGTIFEATGGPPSFFATRGINERTRQPALGLHSLCEPCDPLLPVEDGAAIVTLRFDVLPGLADEYSSSIRFAPAPPEGATGGSVDPRIFLVGEPRLPVYDIPEGWTSIEILDDADVQILYPPELVRADSNFDFRVDISDASNTLLALFVSQNIGFPCREAADANDDGSIDISDAIYTLAFLFLDGSPPPPPFPEPGPEPAGGSLGCSIR